MALTPEDFGGFFEEVHGHRPFPWQTDIVQRIVEEGSWPALVDVPTGLGKTALIDVAIFLAALTANTPGVGRLGRRRIFFVVDRRIVVDQAHSRAQHVSRMLQSACDGGVVQQVAEGLRGLGEVDRDSVLPVVRMRGGVTWDAAWLSRPDLPGVVTGTVDQVGSRLFFRAYGATPHRWPLDAALVGTDSLILVDEAHLATAMTTSLTTAREHDLATQVLGLPAPSVVQMTATTAVPPKHGWSYELDVETHLTSTEPVAARRLHAPKLLRTFDSSKATIVRDMTTRAIVHSEQADARVLVVCNTIDRARAVHAELDRILPVSVHRSLLIGRSRPIDRERVVDEAIKLFGADREKDGAPGPAVLVATQTVEVGADLDASALITESAPWDSLVQRIGRVNRRGDLSNAPVDVVHDGESKGSMYGDPREVTWTFLADATAADGRQALDVSPLGCSALRSRIGDAAYQTPPTAPLLMPAILDAWVRTTPVPTNDPPLDAYLHGLDNGVAPVSLTWRDGLDGGPDLGTEQTTALIDVIPVRSSETIEVPIAAIRRWLLDERALPLTEFDDEDDDIAFGDDEDEPRVARRVLDPDGTTRWAWALGSELRPGDQVVVPAALGGLDAYGWAPASRARVRDVSEAAALDAQRCVLKLDERLPHRLGIKGPAPSLWDDVWSLCESDDVKTAKDLATSIGVRVRAWLVDAGPSSLSEDTPENDVSTNPWRRSGRWEELHVAMAGALAQESAISSPPSTPAERNVVPVAVMKSQTTEAARWQELRDDRQDGTVHLHVRVLLVDHQRDVGQRAADIARRLGLPEHVQRVVFDAARWHDLGKVDPRFQAMLFGGDPVRAAIADEPLAKSGMPPGDMQQHRDARSRSGLPRGARHEAWSAELVAAHLGRVSPHYEGDTELLLHLVASHHGRARPLLPWAADGAEHDLTATIDGTEVTTSLPRRVDVGLAERFATLNHRYGRWGLALLESIVRCADMTISGEGR